MNNEIEESLELNGYMGELYAYFLGVDSIKNITVADECLCGEEEPYELPEGAEVILTMDHVVVPGMALGFIQFFIWRGQRYVAEQNASPILFWKANKFEIGFRDPLLGWFEHMELGDEYAGCVWFNSNRELTDYDGVYELPSEVITKFEKLGYNMDYAK